MQVLALAIHTARRIGELGFLLGALGAVLLMIEGFLPSGNGKSSPARPGGALLIAVGFVLAIVYIHWS